MAKKKPKLPIRKRHIAADKNGNICRIEVDITQSNNVRKYPPDGIKAVFKVIRQVEEGEFEEVI